MIPFRVYFADGSAIEIKAPTAEAARSKAREARPGVGIAKVKVIKAEKLA